jgi:iron(III) transport system substrate-binding protein
MPLYLRGVRIITVLLIGTLSLMFIATKVMAAEQSTLTVVANYDGKGEIFKEFNKKTGIHVYFLDISANEVLARSETGNGKAVADLWFGDGVDSMIKAKEKNMLEAYTSTEAETIPAKYKDPDGCWIGVSLILSGFLANLDVLAERTLAAPRLWADLIKPGYQGTVVLSDPAISGTIFTVAASLLQKLGEDEGGKYFQALGKNVPFFSRSSIDPQKKVMAGEMGVTIVPLSKDLLTEKPKEQKGGVKANSNVQAVFPKDGIPWMPAGMAIFKNAQNPEAAKAFIDWALSVDGQKVIQDNDPRIMVRPEIELPKELEGVSLADLLEFDVVKAGADRQKILTTWSQQVKSKK